jgi:putative transcriptional regulator
MPAAGFACLTDDTHMGGTSSESESRSLRGHLLVAAPGLADPNFYRSVVIMIHHDQGGAVGLVLNRTSNSTVADIWDMVSADPCDCQQLLNLGGPVAGPLMALHTIAACSESEVIPGVHFSARKESLEKIVRDPQLRFRIFSGYSGWAAGQLEGELRSGGWLTIEATREFVFGEPEEIWKLTAQAIGERIIQPVLERTKRPADPSQN